MLPSQGRFDPEVTLVIFQILGFTEDRTMKRGNYLEYTVPGGGGGGEQNAGRLRGGD